MTRVGGLKPKSIDVRFVAATNRNLEEEVAAGRFRRDLYFRLNGMTLHVPPLRTRRGEIAQLAAIFLRQFSQSLAGPPPSLSDEAQQILEEHVWPGNIRELRNMMERAVLLCMGDEIRPEHLLLDSMSVNAIMTAPPAAREMAGRPTQPAGITIDDAGQGPVAAEIPGEPERERILRVLAECGGNQSRAAKILGIARSTLVLRLNEYRVPRPRK